MRLLRGRSKTWAGIGLVTVLAAITASACVERADAPTTDETSAPEVLTGLDRIERDGHALLEGRRVGLVAHGASVSRSGRHAIDVLRERGIQLVRLFSPEHGLRGGAAAGEPVADGVDPVSGLEVVSFYGPRTAPAPEHLADLEVLVVDLQDVGVRFYTYASTMLLSVRAAIQAGVDVVVLDRPNPLGGARAAGPPRFAEQPTTLVSMTPGTLVHGLTLGEIARAAFPMAREPDVASAGRVFVVTMKGWARSMSWAETGLSWIAPSPNLRSPEATSVYPAIAMLEATNVSEGRGSSAPFRQFGAPWFGPGLVDDLVQLFADFGIEAEAITFVPEPSEAAQSPKYSGEECRGLRLGSASNEVDLYALGLRLLERLQSEPEFALRRDGDALTWLLGTPRPLVSLREGSVTPHLAEVRNEGQAWLQDRTSTLLYP